MDLKNKVTNKDTVAMIQAVLILIALYNNLEQCQCWTEVKGNEWGLLIDKMWGDKGE